MDDKGDILDYENEQPDIRLYTKKTILGFSVFFTTIFGGVLLFQNLKTLGNKKAANLVLGFSIVFTILLIIIVNIPEKPITSLTIVLNTVGGAILSEYFFNKYIPMNSKYEKKKIWKPLLISILIITPFIVMLFI